MPRLPCAFSLETIFVLVLSGMACRGFNPNKSDVRAARQGAGDEPKTKANDRPSDAEPAVPGYFIYCRDRALPEPTHRQVGCGLSSEQNKAIIPSQSTWKLTLPAESAGIKLVQTALDDPKSPLRVLFDLTVSEGNLGTADLAAVLDAAEVTLSYRATAASTERMLAATGKGALFKGRLVDEGSEGTIPKTNDPSTL